MRAEISSSAARLRELLRSRASEIVGCLPATKQPAGQITKILSSLLTKNIPLHAQGKSVI
jgi:hypothetical protein